MLHAKRNFVQETHQIIKKWNPYQHNFRILNENNDFDAYFVDNSMFLMCDSLFRACNAWRRRQNLCSLYISCL